jgi:hypothetical protein
MKIMKTLLFLTILILASCEKQYQKQLHHYTVTFTNENGDVETAIYKLVERNKDFVIFHSNGWQSWDTLFFDDKTHLHGVLGDWVSQQTHKSDFTGELTVNKHNRLEITGVAMKHMGWMQPLKEYAVTIH